MVVFSTMQKQHKWNARHIRNKKRVFQAARRGRLNLTRGREGLSEKAKATPESQTVGNPSIHMMNL